MKKLMVIAVAAICCAALAEDAKNAPAGRRAYLGGAHEMAIGGSIMRIATNPKLAEQLKITEEQQAKIKALLEAQREANQGIREKLRAAMEKQVTLLKAEKVDEAAVMAVIDETFELRKAQAKAQTKQLIEIKSVLTPEQISKGLELAKEFRGKGLPGRRTAEGRRGQKKEAGEKKD